jgi:CPA1 family monovalent cation:H+ antiporter
MLSATTAMLVLLAVVLSGFTGRLVRGIPLPLVQIAFGAALTWALGHSAPLEPEFFLFFFIPPLLFADARRYPKREFIRLWRPITTLALGLVVFTVVGAGFFIDWLVPSIPLPVAFALAAVLSPTDPVAVSAITASTPVPRTMMHLLEGEALLNDATGLVCFRFAVAAMMTGTFSVLQATVSFVVVAVGGVLVGAALPWVVGALQRVLVDKGGEDPGTQILVTLLQPFAAYLLAEHMHLSGILSAVAAGLMLPYVELQRTGSAETRLSGNAVWRMVQFALDGAIFVLLGEQIPGIIAGHREVATEARVHSAWSLVLYVAAISAALIALRFVWIVVSARIAGLRAQRRGEPIDRPPLRLVAAMAVAGVRGAITLAGVLTLPLTLPDGAAFPGRAVAVFIACGVIVASLLTASLLLPFLLADFDVAATSGKRDDDRTRSLLADVAVRRIEAVQHDHTLSIDAELYLEAAARIVGVYRRLQHAHSLEVDADEQEHARKLVHAERELRLVALRAEREELLRLRRLREVSDESTTRFMRELDLLETQLTHVDAH